MNNYQLKTRQVCLFLISFLPVVKIFSLPSLIAGSANQDTWLSSLISFALDFITLSVILLACKNAKTDFFGLLENSFGKTGAKIILVFYLVYFFLKAIVPLSEQKDYVELTLYTLKPTLVYFLPFFILAFYLCFKQIRILGRVSDVLWMVTINGFILLFTLSLSNADFEAVLPIGANGIANVLKGSYSSLNWFGDAVYVMFFIGHFKYEKKAGLKILLSFIISTVMVIAFMIIFYCIFTSIAYRQRFALTEISKYTIVINDLGRFDYIGIILILFSNLFALCLPIYFCSKILDYVFNIKFKWIAPCISVGLQVLILIVFNQHVASLGTFILAYCSPFFFLLSNVLPVIISLILRKENSYATQKS